MYVLYPPTLLMRFYFNKYFTANCCYSPGFWYIKLTNEYACFYTKNIYYILLGTARSGYAFSFVNPLHIVDNQFEGTGTLLFSC